MFKFKLSFQHVISTVALITVTGISWSSQAQAITINGVSSGTWINPEPGSNFNPQFSGERTNTFEWGDANGFGTGANQLSFTGNLFSTSNNSLFKLGDLTYFNGIIATDTTVDNISLNASISLTSPSQINQDFTFQLQLVSTLNTDDAQESADSVFFTSSFPNKTFNLNGTPTKLQVVGFSKDGGTTTISELRVLESASDQAGLYAKFVTVPEPSYGWSHLLALTTLGGGYILKRKLRRQKLVANKG